MTTAQAVVDSHIHFWDTDRFDYPWLQGFSELNRPFVPADLDVGEVQIEPDLRPGQSRVGGRG